MSVEERALEWLVGAAMLLALVCLAGHLAGAFAALPPILAP